MTSPYAGPRRLVPDARQHFAALQLAAELYPEKLKDYGGDVYLHRKPFDTEMGHGDFFGGMFAVMNALQAMRLPAGATVVEVGSGPGWLTEVLLALGHSVIAVEPSAAMHAAASQRIGLLADRLGGIRLPRYEQVTATLEDWDMAGFARCADGVMFHEAFHHVIDEAETAARSFALLQPGGVLSISGDSLWQPGNADQERFFTEESDRYGTLESPFTRGYLRHLLEGAGFAPVTFYHAVNGWFPLAQEDVALRDAARPSADDVNNVLARRPSGVGEAFLREPERALVEFVLLETAWRAGRLLVTAWVFNAGPHTLPCVAEQPRGGVTIGLVPDGPGDPPSRVALPGALAPGESVRMEMAFAIAQPAAGYRLRAVAEEMCWLRGEAVVAA